MYEFSFVFLSVCVCVCRRGGSAIILKKSFISLETESLIGLELSS